MELSTMYKAEKGLIKISAEVVGNTIERIRITGDFFMIPEEALLQLEISLSGTMIESRSVVEVLDRFYATGVITPSMTKEDLVKAIMGLKKE